MIQTSLLLLLLTHQQVIHLFHLWAKFRWVVLYMVFQRDSMVVGKYRRIRGREMKSGTAFS